MGINLIKKYTSSPFHLQRSIVPQGEEDGAYARGGYNPNAVYNNDAANAAVEGFGQIVGAGLKARAKDVKKPKEEKVDQGLEDFKKKVSDADTAGKKRDKEYQEEGLKNISAEIEAEETNDALSGVLKKFSKRGI